MVDASDDANRFSGYSGSKNKVRGGLGGGINGVDIFKLKPIYRDITSIMFAKDVMD